MAIRRTPTVPRSPRQSPSPGRIVIDRTNPPTPDPEQAPDRTPPVDDEWYVFDPDTGGVEAINTDPGVIARSGGGRGHGHGHGHGGGHGHGHGFGGLGHGHRGTIDVPPAPLYNPELGDLGQSNYTPLIRENLELLTRNQGLTDFGRNMRQRLMNIINRGGKLPGNTDLLKFERAREFLEKGRRTMHQTARDALAARNTLGVPGQLSGPELSTFGRIEQRLGEEFAARLRDIQIEQMDQENQRISEALSLATGLSADAARNVLGAAQAAGRQQEVLTTAALETLRTNTAWNMFLADFGLRREQVMHEIQSGNIASVLPFLQLFLGSVGQSTGGFIGHGH